MSRPYDRSPLPPLESALSVSRPLTGIDNKRGLVLREMRQLAVTLRRAESQPFYAMRDVSEAFAVPLRTVALVYQQLEAEGILLRLRGSHTQLIGLDRRPRSQIAGSVGLMLSIYAFRHYVHRRAFSRSIGDLLGAQSLIVDNVFFWDGEDSLSDFVDRLPRHHFDHAVWFQPLAHNRDCILTMKDRGIRTLVISDAELGSIPGDIQIQWDNATRTVLRHWKSQHRIRRVVLPENGQRTPARQHHFAFLARSEGLECEEFPSDPSLAHHLATPGVLAERCGIALLDEVGTVEFCLRHPQAFLQLSKNHRILFGRDLPSIPFAAPGELNVERLFFPMEEIIDSALDRLARWRGGQSPTRPTVLAGEAEIGHTHAMWM